MKLNIVPVNMFRQVPDRGTWRRVLETFKGLPLLPDI